MNGLNAGVVAVLLVVSLPLQVPVPASAPASPVSGQAEAGERIYDRCIGCHSPERNRTGPLHCSLLGRVSGTTPGYAYSDAMKNSNIVWTVETLDAFLQAPMDYVTGTSMGFAGITDSQERLDLIAWLATLNAASSLCIVD